MKPPDRFGFVDLMTYALVTTLEYEKSKALTYTKAINSKDSEK